MKTACPHCHEEFDIDENMLGLEICCSNCNQDFKIARVGETVKPAVPAAPSPVQAQPMSQGQAMPQAQAFPQGQAMPQGQAFPQAQAGPQQNFKPERIVSYTAFKRIADFKGRSTRYEVLCFFAFSFLLSILFSLLALFLGTSGKIMGVIGMLIYWLYRLVLFFTNISLSIRRMHDIGCSGWHSLLMYLFPVGSIYYTYIFWKDSQKNSNEYGPNPKGINTGAPPVRPSKIIWIASIASSAILLLGIVIGIAVFS